MAGTALQQGHSPEREPRHGDSRHSCSGRSQLPGVPLPADHGSIRCLKQCTSFFTPGCRSDLLCRTYVYWWVHAIRGQSPGAREVRLSSNGSLPQLKLLSFGRPVRLTNRCRGSRNCNGRPDLGCRAAEVGGGGAAAAKGPVHRPGRRLAAAVPDAPLPRLASAPCFTRTQRH